MAGASLSDFGFVLRDFSFFDAPYGYYLLPSTFYLLPSTFYLLPSIRYTIRCRTSFIKKPDTDNIFKLVSIGYKINKLPTKI
ncbi:MAG: hypothetical protein EAZ86_26350 [Oscillatoriales cyanobacterium]|nr:MAG: hypothetical protein EAZ86_26350 [Oscillatoriales cyanobacterium]